MFEACNVEKGRKVQGGRILSQGTGLSYPIQRHLNLLPCPFTLWMAHIHNPMSQGLKILLQPISSPSSKLIEVYLTSDINSGSSLSPDQSVRERAGVLHVLDTLCTPTEILQLWMQTHGGGWRNNYFLWVHILTCLNVSKVARHWKEPMWREALLTDDITVTKGVQQHILEPLLHLVDIGSN
jgi:hypothetical protein